MTRYWCVNTPSIRAFLHYIPYAVLTAMTFPAVLTASGNLIAGCLGLAAAVIFALRGKSLTTVAIAACAAVYLTDLLMAWL